MPFVIMLDEDDNGYKAGRFLRASDLGMESDNSEWKPVIHDTISHQFVVPNGTMGQRWEEGKKWNLKLETEDGTKINPAMSMAEEDYELKTIQFPFFDSKGDGIFERPIATRKVTLADGKEVYVATVYDLMTSQYGIKPVSYTHLTLPTTPHW